MRNYTLQTFRPGLFSGTLNPDKLKEVLNEHAARGWKFTRAIRERKRVWLIFTREAHFLIFEREN